MSDAPQPGVGGDRVAAETAAAPAEEEYRPAPSTALQSAQQSKYHLSGNKINATARRKANGEKIPVTEIPKEVWPYISARVAEINGELDRIQDWGDKHPGFRGNKVLDKIREVNPAFAGQLAGYVSGAAPVVGGARNPLLQRIIGLGHLVDERFNQGTYANRNALVKSYTSGVNGRNLVSQLTSLDHLDYLNELAGKVPYIPGIGAAMNRAIQAGLKEGPEAIGWITDFVKGQPGLSDEARQNLTLYMRELTLIAPEVARAQKGAAPTISEEQEFIKGMTGYAPDILQRNIEGARHLIQQRLMENGANFARGMGGNIPGEFANLFKKFENRGMGFDDPAEKGTDQPPPAQLRSGRTFSEELKHQLTQPVLPPPSAAPAAPATPAAPAPPSAAPAAAPAAPAAPATAPGKSSLPNADEARAWARAHPDDPYAKRILQSLGEQ
jgi:hypothetical protein